MDKPHKILLIDDDEELLELLHDYFVRDGFDVTCAYDGPTGIRAVLSGEYDIVVLDVMLPQQSGFEVLAKIRTSSAASIPVIMLTARGDDADRIAGLEHGADDYVAKPCTPRELAARLRAILKRVAVAPDTTTPKVPTQHLQAGTIQIWPTQRRAEDDGEPLTLTSTEFSLLAVLVRYAGLPVSKEQLSEEVLGHPLERFSRSLDMHIHSIRKKLKPLADGRSRIQTVSRKGYLLIAEQ